MITAAELAKGRALRDAERGETWQSRTTHALSDWLDRHCDGLLEAAEALAEKDAQIAALRDALGDIQNVANMAVEMKVYQPFVELKRVAHLAFDVLRETPAPTQETQDPRYKHILSGDYYMPGKKEGG